MVSVATLAQVARKRFAGSAPLRTKQSIHYYCSRGYIYLLDIPAISRAATYWLPDFGSGATYSLRLPSYHKFL